MLITVNKTSERQFRNLNNGDWFLFSLTDEEGIDLFQKTSMTEYRKFDEMETVFVEPDTAVVKVRITEILVDTA